MESTEELQQRSTHLLLEARGVSRRFGNRWAVSGVNLKLSRGRSLLVAGHNGAGKTTLLRILATTLRPTGGTLRVGGFDPRRMLQQARRSVAMLAQRNGLYLELTALENLRVLERLRQPRHDPARLVALLERVGLAGREHDVVRGFSAGMRKRLAFAKVLLQDAEIVLLDEPYGQLDPAGFAFVDQLISELVAQDRSVVAVTHLIERGASLLQSGVVLEAGKMAWVGSAADLPRVFHDVGASSRAETAASQGL